MCVLLLVIALVLYVVLPSCCFFKTKAQKQKPIIELDNIAFSGQRETLILVTGMSPQAIYPVRTKQGQGREVGLAVVHQVHHGFAEIPGSQSLPGMMESHF